MGSFDGRILAQITVPTGVSVAATNSGGGPTTVNLTAGTYYLDTLCTHLQTQLNATRTPANWTVTLSTGVNGTGRVSINWTGTGTYSLTWTTTNLRDVLGFTANLAGVTQGVASTGSKQAKGIWLPDAPLMMDGDPGRAPTFSDFRATMSPSGQVYSVSGNAFYQHTNLVYSVVAKAKVWESQAALANASWEQFVIDCQLGRGHVWFTPGSLVQIYDHTGTKLGIDANGGSGLTTGWSILDITNIAPEKRIAQWTGLWQIKLPRIVSSG